MSAPRGESPMPGFLPGDSRHLGAIPRRIVLFNSSSVLRFRFLQIDRTYDAAIYAAVIIVKKDELVRFCLYYT